MPSIPYFIQKREERRRARRTRAGTRAGLIFSLLFSLSLVGAVFLFTLGYTNLIVDLPSLNAIPALLEPPNGALLQPTRLYDRSGQHLLYTLEDPGAAGREYIYVPAEWTPVETPNETGWDSSKLSGQAPKWLIAAVLAVQDPTFWEHDGYSLQGLRQGEQPTLAQRLVIDLLLREEHASLKRHLRERLVAGQITRYFGRPRIIEWYLNSAPFGPNIIGADAAARAYFEKPAAGLNLAEAALLAAVVESPSLNPFSAPEIVKERQQQVLTLMLTQGLISREEMQEALLAPLSFRKASPAQENAAPAFTRLVLEQLGQRYGNRWLERGGLTVITSLDYDLQMQLNCAAEEELNRLQSGMIARQIPLSEECSAARLLPTQPFSGDLSNRELAANVLVYDPQSGQVLGMAGGASAGLDPARLPGHSPGTLFAPFIYLTAFTRGYSPASLLWDIPLVAGESEVMESTQAAVYKGPMRLRTAFANDYSVPALHILAQVGPENVWQIARQLGAGSISLEAVKDFDDNQTLLQGGEVTLLEMVQTFGVLANQGAATGMAAPGSAAQAPTLLPVTVLEVKDSTGQTWMSCRESLFQCPLQARPVVSPQLAYLMTHVLSDEVERWASLGHPNPLEVGRPAAVKIGRTSGSEGAWTVGYTPQLVSGVWIGPTSKDPEAAPFSPEEVKALTNSAAALWHAVLQYASREQVPQSWTVPGGIRQVEVCDPSGLLPTAACPSTVAEVFLEGQEPIHGDTLYRNFAVNRETGRLATVFTPPGLVEERVYLVPPPEAAQWAEKAGLPVPPAAYDSIYAPGPSSGSAQITSPATFSHVKGLVEISGTASGRTFSHYRLQVGKGLNPREWLQIGEDMLQPVENGTLGSWDTQGLSGLYALRLMVVSLDQRVETALLQVTVDNTAPKVRIVRPGSGAEIEQDRKESVIFLVEAEDDTALAAVDFYVDGELWTSIADAPYLAAWSGGRGRHTLRAVGRDLAGNSSEVETEFTVSDNNY